MAKPYFSVIVPVLNEQEYIKDLLNALTRQTFSDFELIVVDAQSTDKTLEVVKSYDKKLKVKIVITKERNVPLSRNLGVEKAIADNLFLVDADNYPDEKFMQEAKNDLEKGFDLLVPRLSPSKKSVFNSLLYSFSNNLIRFMLKTPRIFTTGSSLVVTKKYYEKVKGFDPKIFVTDDQDFVRRVKKAGGKVKFLNKQSVIFSTRRFDSEGFPAYFKYVYSFIYLLFSERIEKNIYKYEMGGHIFKK